MTGRPVPPLHVPRYASLGDHGAGDLPGGGLPVGAFATLGCSTFVFATGQKVNQQAPRPWDCQTAEKRPGVVPGGSIDGHIWQSHGSCLGRGAILILGSWPLRINL